MPKRRKLSERAEANALGVAYFHTTATQNLSAEEIQDFREVFKLFDVDGSNSIDSQELGTAMRSLGIHRCCISPSLGD